MVSIEWVGGEGVGQENGYAAGTAPSAVGRRFDSNTVVRSPDFSQQKEERGGWRYCLPSTRMRLADLGPLAHQDQFHPCQQLGAQRSRSVSEAWQILAGVHTSSFW